MIRVSWRTHHGHTHITFRSGIDLAHAGAIILGDADAADLITHLAARYPTTETPR